MPTVQHMAGTHDRRVQELLELGKRVGWEVTLQEGYERRLSMTARRVLWLQTNLASLHVRHQPDLLFAGFGIPPFYLDPKTTTFREDTGNLSVELHPVWLAWLVMPRVVTYFDLDGWLIRADHLHRLIRRIIIPIRWVDGSEGCKTYMELAAELRPDIAVERRSVSDQNATGDPFVLIPRQALCGRVRPWSARTDDFIARRCEYREPNLRWPQSQLAMHEVDPNDPRWTLEKAAYALDFTPAELRPWWNQRLDLSERIVP